MFAGAAREAVFSKPEVIRRVNADFVPVALKAGLVNNPPADEEGQLYREIARSKIVPQGICVVNSTGKVLNWVLMFEDDKSVLAFLDHTLKRYAKYPDAKRPVPAERHGQFPRAKLEDVEDSGKVLPVVERHSDGKACPTTPRLPPGTLVARLFGRALGPDGKPVADATRQEHYVEDRFDVPVDVQEKVANALAKAGTAPVALPEQFVQLCANPAHLGHIDVRPFLFDQNKGEWKQCAFRAQKVKAEQHTTLWRVEGQSEVVSELTFNGKGVHDVKLAWEGFIQMEGKRMTQLLLAAHGTEKLEFNKDDHPLLREKRDEVTFLLGGRPIDLHSGVRYGIIAEQVAAPKN